MANMDSGSIESILVRSPGGAAELANQLGCRLCFSRDATRFPHPLSDMSAHVRAWWAELKSGLVQDAVVMVDASAPPRLSRPLVHLLMGWYAQMRLRVVFVSVDGASRGWVRAHWTAPSDTQC